MSAAYTITLTRQGDLLVNDTQVPAPDGVQPGDGEAVLTWALDQVSDTAGAMKEPLDVTVHDNRPDGYGYFTETIPVGQVLSIEQVRQRHGRPTSGAAAPAEPRQEPAPQPQNTTDTPPQTTPQVAQEPQRGPQQQSPGAHALGDTDTEETTPREPLQRPGERDATRREERERKRRQQEQEKAAKAARRAEAGAGRFAKRLQKDDSEKPSKPTRAERQQDQREARLDLLRQEYAAREQERAQRHGWTKYDPPVARPEYTTQQVKARKNAPWLWLAAAAVVVGGIGVNEYLARQDTLYVAVCVDERDMQRLDDDQACKDASTPPYNRWLYVKEGQKVPQVGQSAPRDSAMLTAPQGEEVAVRYGFDSEGGAASR